MADTTLQVPTPSLIRDELEAAVLRDLLGPAGGPEEEVDENSVRDRYLVGMLAPRRQVMAPEEFDDLAVEVNAPQPEVMSPPIPLKRGAGTTCRLGSDVGT